MRTNNYGNVVTVKKKYKLLYSPMKREKTYSLVLTYSIRAGTVLGTVLDTR